MSSPNEKKPAVPPWVIAIAALLLVSIGLVGGALIVLSRPGKPAAPPDPPKIQPASAGPADEREVKVQWAAVAPVVTAGALLSGELGAVTKQKYLQIMVRTTNTSKNKIINYDPLQNAVGTACTVKDNFGNVYRGPDIPSGEIVGLTTGSTTIYPGKPLDELLVFAAPVDDYESLTLKFDARSVGAAQDLVLAIPREEVRKTSPVTAANAKAIREQSEKVKKFMDDAQRTQAEVNDLLKEMHLEPKAKPRP